MEEPFKLDIKGLKCDNCTYKNEDVPASDYEKWVDCPCPECGANLLTKEDYLTVTKMQLNMEKMNKWFNKLPKPIRKLLVKKDGKVTRVPMDMDGSGEIDIDMDKAYDSGE